MPSDRVILVSDVHYDEWELDMSAADAARKRQAFLDFLAWVADQGRAGKVERFIIDGDLVDIPHPKRLPLLPLYADILAGFSAIVAAGVRFAYVIGNHDSGVVGLTLDSQSPPVTIGYPYVRVPSGGKTFIVEHGHLYDPWLWDYVKHLGQAMWTKDAPPGGSPIFRLAGAPMFTAPGAEPSAGPEPETELLNMDDYWQGSLHDTDLVADRVDWLRSFLAEDLRKDYSDVLNPEVESDAATIAARDELKAQLDARGRGPGDHALVGLTAADLRSFGLNLVHQYLSGPMWRKAARDRLADLAAGLGEPLAGIVMGHTHFADTFSWQDGGTEHTYVNSGSWRADAADLVVIDGGEMILHTRKWTDSLPTLP